MKELRTELEQAEFEARAWYDKFRRLYARMVKAAGDGASGSTGEADRNPPAETNPAVGRPAPFRSRRGF